MLFAVIFFAVMLFAVATGRSFPLVLFPFPDFRFRERVFNMSISLRGEAQSTGVGLRGPASVFQSGAIRYGLVALLAGALALALSNQAKAQITVESLLNKSVSDATAENYKDVDRAIYKFTHRDPEGALDSLTIAKKKNSKLPPPEMMLAQMWIIANQAPQARNALEECVKNNPNDPEAYLVLGDLAFSDRRVAEAELLFTKAEALAATFKENAKRANDFNGRAEAGLAAVAESREKWDTAETYLKNWLKIVDPEGTPHTDGSTPNTSGANAHDRLGRVLFHADPTMKKTTGAKEAYEQFQLAVADDPKSISADIALAQLYEDAKMHDQAKRFISHAVLQPPTEPATKLATLLAAARWALDTNQADDAFNYASQALEVPVDSKAKRTLEAKFLMGVAARMKGDTKTAEKMLEEVFLASPGNFQASNQLAQVLGEQKTDKEKQQRGLEIAMNNQAAAQAGDAGRRDPARALESAATLGWVLFQMNRIPEADQVTQAIINTGVASPDILYYQARLFQEHSQTKEAIAKLKASLSNSRGFFVHRDDAKQWLARLDKENGSDDTGSGSTDTKATDTSADKAPATKASDKTDKGSK
jgi:tetratricopeptide (TPR) repeat protein